jgi:hypothetical protein
LLEIEIDTPPVGAAEPIAIVPVLIDPPTTVDGLSVSPLRTGGVTLSIADFVIPA